MLFATTVIAIVSCASVLTLASPTSSADNALERRSCPESDVAHLQITDSRTSLDVDLTWCSAWAPSPQGNFVNFAASTPKTVFKFINAGTTVPDGKPFDEYSIKGETAPNKPFSYLLTYIFQGQTVEAVFLLVFQQDKTPTLVDYTFTLGGAVRPHWKRPKS